jgi:hypothetical protein
MLRLLEHIPILGHYVVHPLLSTVHFTIDTVQTLLGL